MRAFTGSKSFARREHVRACRWLAVSVLLFVAILPSFTQPEALACPRAGCTVVNLNLTIPKPLVSLEFSATALGVTYNEAFQLIEDGSLLWAFDLSAKQGHKRRLIRVLSQSLADHISKRPLSKTLPDVQQIIA